ncbi:MAG: thioredoxin family protein [Rhodoferax sp.]|nr:thioredoxin family protein [Rhodoferax sp.]
MPTESDLLVVCLCADWCGVCRDFVPLFEALQAEHPEWHLRWVDIEDQADLVDPVEVDDFPTLLVARGNAPLFLGTIRPRREAIERLVQDCQGAGTLSEPSALSGPLLARLRAGPAPAHPA